MAKDKKGPAKKAVKVKDLKTKKDPKGGIMVIAVSHERR